jgi:serine/threonine-protein kinase
VALAFGTRLGPYEIVAPIGAGGMGEVYRSRDTKLNRDVALKILPEAFALDGDRIARFRREAQVLAALNHPHIAQIYGFEDSGSTHALVLELVEGPTLADRIARGPIPLEEALPIATQIAEALEAAHEQGIIHRDLKPANIKLRDDGTVKVLDFGLAKALEPASAITPLITAAPTITPPAHVTGVGVILGTAAYMSPEQVKGFPADHRSDIFSFGVVAYEMLTGRRAFQGETMADVLASVVLREPSLRALPADAHPRLIDFLKRCLEKSPRKRWQAIGDVRLELEALEAAPRLVPAAARSGAAGGPQTRRTLVVAVGALLIGAAASAAWLYQRTAQPAPVTRFSVELGANLQFPFAGRQMLAISPDGEQFVFSASNASMGNDASLYLRRMMDFDSRRINGVRGGIPTFSPDGRRLAFYTLNPGDSTPTIRSVSITGGDTFTVCAVTGPPNGISWSGDDLLFSDGQSIQRVPAKGGVPEPLVHLNAGQSAYGPQVLPDGSIMFTLATGSASDRWERAQIVAESISSHERKLLLTGGGDARYAPTGHLVYAHSGVLYAVPFDVRHLAVRGQSVPVVEGVRRAESFVGSDATAHFSFSNTGTLVYVRGPAVTSTDSDLDLVLGDRSGAVERIKVPSGRYAQPRTSPNGKSLAVSVQNGSDSEISIYDLNGASMIRRLTFGGHDRYPVWSSDSRRIAFQSDREGDLGIWWQDADGGAVERLTRAQAGESHIPDAWSPSGDTLLFTVTRGPRTTLWALSRRDRHVEPVVGIESRLPINAIFSPDGQWIAYEAASPSDLNRGNPIVYVEPFPQTGVKHQISKNDESGHHPLWSGKELSYIPGPGRFVGVSIETQPSFSVGNSANIARTFQIANASGDVRNHDVTSDGKRFIGVSAALITDQSGASLNPEIRIVLNWFTELQQRVPTR